jgi:outer membrane lipoprotein SlyB
MNTSRRWPLAVLVAAAPALGGCASTSSVSTAPIGSSSSSSYSEGYGRVQAIDVVPAEQRGPGAGAVLGAVIGGVLGNQIGSGSGRAAATGAGVVGGAIIGNQIQKRNANDVYRVTVRMDSGERRSFDYARIDDLRVGDRVRVENNQIHMG